MRYKPFYQFSGSSNPFNGRYASLEEIKTSDFADYVTPSTLSEFHNHMEVPDIEPDDTGWKKIKGSQFEKLAEFGKASSRSSIRIAPIDKIYKNVITKNKPSGPKKKGLKRLLVLYRTAVLRTNYRLLLINAHGVLAHSSLTKISYKFFDEDQKFNTAKVILANDPDILVLQEVENAEALKKFNGYYLDDKKLKKKLGAEYSKLDNALKAKQGHRYRGRYPYFSIIDAHDQRHIDVAVLSRYPIVSSVTHQFEKIDQYANRRRDWQWLFSRDCLEVTIGLEDADGGGLHTKSDGTFDIHDYPNYTNSSNDPPRIFSPKISKTITVFANHFKSRLGEADPREKSRPYKRRYQQARRVAEIVEERFGRQNGNTGTLAGNFVVAGDLNDDPSARALDPLLEDGQLWNVVQAGDPSNGVNWTHYHRRQGSQLDYLLLSPEIRRKNPRLRPDIEIRGMRTYRNAPIPQMSKDAAVRFENMGPDGTEASDHAAVFVDIEV